MGVSGKEEPMEEKLWHKHKWPAGVAHDVSGYDRPLFSSLSCHIAEKGADHV